MIFADANRGEFLLISGACRKGRLTEGHSLLQAEP